MGDKEDLSAEQAAVFERITKSLSSAESEMEFTSAQSIEKTSAALKNYKCDFDNGSQDADAGLSFEIGFVYYKGTRCYTQQYVGQGWESKITNLQNAPDVTIPDKFVVDPHEWQRRGAAQLQYLCQSNFRGGICGDSMGLGKTFLAILAMELGKNDPGEFSLVVCPASCKLQWLTEIIQSYKKGHEPKVLVLEDHSKTAQTLLAEKWDIVIVSYHFLGTSHRALKSFADKMAKYDDGVGTKPVRPTTALHSEFWTLSQKMVKRLVLDECHVIKKEDGGWYKAAQAIPRFATIMLSATALNNRWADIANPVALLRGHHINTKQRFLHAFCEIDTKRASQYAEPDIISLQRFLLAFVIARPSSSLHIPGLILKDMLFKLDETEMEHVNESMTKYNRARNALSASDRGSTVEVAALSYAVLAQLQAAHTVMGQYSKDRGLEKIDADELDASVEDIASYLVDRHSLQSVKTRAHWLAHIQDIEKSKLMHCVRFDGVLNKDQKEAARAIFDRAPGFNVILITSGSGGVGLNMQSASIVIQTEVWWNENRERQAYARCHRQGQTQAVKVFRLYATNSAVDNTIRQSQERKIAINTKIMSAIVRKVDEPVKIPSYEE